MGDKQTSDLDGIIVASMAWDGGMGRFTRELAAVLNTHVPVTLIAPPMNEEPDVAQRRTFAHPDRTQPFFLRAIRLILMNIGLAWHVLQTARKGVPFLLVDLHPTIPLSYLPALAARAKGAVTILNLHDFLPHKFRYPKPFHGLERKMRMAIYRGFDRLVVLTEKQEQRLQEEAKVSQKHIARITHGAFRVADIAPPMGDMPDRFMLFGAARQNKGVQEALLALKQLRAERDNIAIRVYLTPHREEAEYWAECEQILQDLGDIELHVGFVPEENLSAAFSHVDAILCPYQGFDSQSGISVLAVSSGIPLICNKAASVPEITSENDKWPLIDEPADVDKVCTALNAFLAVPRAERLVEAKRLQDLSLKRDEWSDAAATIIETAIKV